MAAMSLGSVIDAGTSICAIMMTQTGPRRCVIHHELVPEFLPGSMLNAFAQHALRCDTKIGLAVKLDPNAKTNDVVHAIPSSAVVFERFGMDPNADGELPLAEICAAAGIEFETFLQAMNEIDWHQEAPANTPDDSKSSSEFR